MSKIILLNKPFNVLCQFTDKSKRSTLADFVDIKDVYPAGRLDYDSEGLVLLTDCGVLQHQISHPKTKMTKTYWAQVEGTPSSMDLTPITKGITLKDGPCRPAQVRVMETAHCWPRNPPIRERANIPTTWLEIIITEGRNRQVRRMTAAVGFPTLRLIRSAIGQWSINGILPGQYKSLTVPTPASNKKTFKHTPNRNRSV